MNKIILVFDAVNFTKESFEFVKRQNEEKTSLFIAYFLTPEEHSSLFNYSLIPIEEGYIYTPYVDIELVLQNIDYFKMLCKKYNIECRVYEKIWKKALPSLILETRFADLLVIIMESYFSDETPKVYDNCINNILHSSECPVFFIPCNFSLPLKIIFSYDGSISSMFAIKQFCYLFPELHSRVVTLIHASDKPCEIPDLELFESFIKRCFTFLKIIKINISLSKYYDNLMCENEPTLLVAGAFGSPGISEMFKSSFLSEALWQHKIPLFIAHPPKNR